MLSLLLFIPSITSQFRHFPPKRYVKLRIVPKYDCMYKNIYLLSKTIDYTTIGSPFRMYSTKMDAGTTSVASIPPGDNIITINLNYNGNVIILNRSKSELLRNTLNRLHISILKTLDKGKSGNNKLKISLSDISLLDDNCNQIDMDTPIVDALLNF